MKLSEETRRLFRKILLGAGVGTATLGFYGCISVPVAVYGPPPVEQRVNEERVVIRGEVLSSATNEPIPGIEVSIESNFRGSFDMKTNMDGLFSINAPL